MGQSFKNCFFSLFLSAGSVLLVFADEPPNGVEFNNSVNPSVTKYVKRQFELEDYTRGVQILKNSELLQKKQAASNEALRKYVEEILAIDEESTRLLSHRSRVDYIRSKRLIENCPSFFLDPACDAEMACTDEKEEPGDLVSEIRSLLPLDEGNICLLTSLPKEQECDTGRRMRCKLNGWKLVCYKSPKRYVGNVEKKSQ